MIFSIFRPPAEGETVAECRLGDICDASSFSYEQYFCGVGTFEIKIPVNSAFAGALEPNLLLYTPRYGGFIIKNILRTDNETKLTGYDLNGILRDRVVLTADSVSDGKDAVSGTTEYCVKHFVANNLVSAADNGRNIPRLAVAEDCGRGIANDHYLASPENLDDVVRTMCENAGLGYRITMDFSAGESQAVFTFDVQEQFDAAESGGQRPAFSVGLGNISAMEREVGVTAEKNALWCDTGSAPQFVFKQDTPPVSWDRREDFAALSLVDKFDGEEITGTARQVMADKYAQTDSLVVTAGDIREYGRSYNLGDMVCVYDKRSKALLESWISGAEIKLTATEQSVKLILGSAKPRLLDGLAKKSDLLKKSQSDFPPASDVYAIKTLNYLDSSVRSEKCEFRSGAAILDESVEYGIVQCNTGNVLAKVMHAGDGSVRITSDFASQGRSQGEVTLNSGSVYLSEITNGTTRFAMTKTSTGGLRITFGTNYVQFNVDGTITFKHKDGTRTI